MKTHRTALIGLAVAGALLELSLVRGWLGAFSLLTHPGFPAPDQDALIWLLGDGPTGVSRFLVLLAAAFIPYLAAFASAQRLCDRAGLTLALAGAVLLGATMLLSFPAGAIDIFHNIMDGRLLWAYHLNPMVTAPSEISGDPLYGYLHYWQDWRSSYGPLWFLLTAPAALVGGTDLTRSIIAYKALPFAFELVCVGLIALIVRRTAPRQAAAAVVCFGWNPLVLWETAGNGHNDIVMMAFALLALVLLQTRRWPLAFPLLACSVLIKYVSLVLLPVFVVWVYWRHGRQAAVPLALGLLGALVISVAVFLPLWSGTRTFEPLRSQSHYIIFSPAGALLGTWGNDVPNTSRVVHVKVALTTVFALLYGLSLLRLRSSPCSLIWTCGATMFLVLVLLTWWFWPWYVVWGLAFAALLPLSSQARLFVLFSMTAVLVSVSSAWRYTLWNLDSPYALAVGTALLVFLPPVLYAVLHSHEWMAADGGTVAAPADPAP